MYSMDDRENCNLEIYEFNLRINRGESKNRFVMNASYLFFESKNFEKNFYSLRLISSVRGTANRANEVEKMDRV